MSSPGVSRRLADRDPYDIAREVLRTNEFMSIASATLDGNPWVVAVRNRGFLDGCLRRSSDPTRHHSQLIKRNPRIGYLLYDSSSRVADEAKLALYGQAVVDAGVPDEIEGEAYLARITDAWVLISEMVNGQWRPKVKVDPVKIGDVV